MFYLTDGPAKAHWLAADERDWLIDRLRRERMVREAHGRHTLWEALAHPRVLVLGSVSTCARWRIPVVVGYAPARFRGVNRDAVPGMSINGHQVSV